MPGLGMWAAPVARRGGLALASVADAGEAGVREASLVAVRVDEEGVLPLLARLTAAQAVALLVLGTPPAEGEVAGVAFAANRLRGALAESARSCLLAKSGRVGGAATEDGSRELIEADARGALDAALAEDAEWEADPDFGYELLVGAPGLAVELGDLLVPRFLYRRADRVYEHAALVPELKRRRRDALERVEGLDPAIVAALG